MMQRMRFSHDLEYDAAPEAVAAMLADPAFREQVCDALHVLRHEVSVQGAGAGMTVVVDQTQPAGGVPSFAKKFVGDEIRIVQRERWRDTTKADLDIEIPGKPGTMKGGITLVGDGTHTVQTVAGSRSRPCGRSWCADVSTCAALPATSSAASRARCARGPRRRRQARSRRAWQQRGVASMDASCC